MTFRSTLSHTICFLIFHVNGSMLISHFLDLSLHAITLRQCVHVSFTPFQQETSSHVEQPSQVRFSRVTSQLSQVWKVKNLLQPYSFFSLSLNFYCLSSSKASLML